MNSRKTNKQLSASKVVVNAAVAVVFLWLAYKIIDIIFLFFFAIVLTLILNRPTVWLEQRGLKRTPAALLTFFAMLIFFIAIAWLVIPNILDQLSQLISRMPEYLGRVEDQLAKLLDDYPALQRNFNNGEDIPVLSDILATLTRFSLSLIQWLFLLVIFFSLVAYMMVNPQPLLETYLLFFPVEKRRKATVALTRAANMMVGWLYSNLLVGVIEGIAVFFFLRFMDVPGVWVWAGLAVAAELVPKLGLYIMALPPTLIALSEDPMKALWVYGFYLALNEVMFDFVMPRIRQKTMNLHPVSTLFVLLAMTAAFGIVGALIATPITAFIKAYYQAFFLSRQTRTDIRSKVMRILNYR